MGAVYSFDTTTSGRSGDAARVEVRVGNGPQWTSVVRSVVGHLARRAAYDQDMVVDLRLAVDEVCGVLGDLSPAGQEFTCAFDVRPDRMDVEFTTELTERGRPMPADSLGWLLLRGVTDELITLRTPGVGGAADELRIRLGRRIR
ncbi:MAG: hypothetical protein ACJ72N_00030 [Labedaea sp.]